MASEDRRQAPGLSGRTSAPSVFDEAHLFDFFQAVRLLQSNSGGRADVGHDARPRDEAVNFGAVASLGFPASAVHAIHDRAAEGRPPLMEVAFFGLTGPSGVLPAFYSEMVIEEGENGPLRDFLRLFEHRLLSLFYRAWERNRPHLAASTEARGRFDGYLRSLAGLALDVEPRAAGTSDLAHSGLFASRRRSATGLQVLLEDVLNGPDSPIDIGIHPIHVEIVPFIGRWIELDPACRLRLARSNRLQSGTPLGSRVRDYQGKFRVRVGPLGLDQFRSLQPESPHGAFGSIVDLTTRFIGPEMEFDIELVLRADETPRSRLGRAPDIVRLGRMRLLSRRAGDDFAVVLPSTAGRETR